MNTHFQTNLTSEIKCFILITIQIEDATEDETSNLLSEIKRSSSLDDKHDREGKSEKVEIKIDTIDEKDIMTEKGGKDSPLPAIDLSTHLASGDESSSIN